MDVRLESSWRKALEREFGEAYFSDLAAFVRNEYVTATVYPKPTDVFRAFALTPFESVKVVILGQDPYHGAGQAMGLSFSVPEKVKIPPSLRNIYTELHDDIGGSTAAHGDLTHWAEQGVLLLNATLTVRAGQAGSHQGRGWERFTDAAIQALSEQRKNVVFILWGNYARQKKALIDESRHLVIQSPHPSPFSAASGFFGSKPFSRANAYLQQHHIAPVQWV